MADETGAIPMMPAVDTTATSGTLDAILKAPKATYYGPESKAALDRLLELHQQRVNAKPTLISQALQNAATWLQPTRSGTVGEAIGNAMTGQRELADTEFKRQQDTSELALKIAQMKDAALRQNQVQELINQAYDQNTGRIDQVALRKLMVLDQPAAASIIAMDKAMRGERTLGKDQLLIATDPTTGKTSVQFGNMAPEYKEYEQGGAKFRYDTRNPNYVELFTAQGWKPHSGTPTAPAAAPAAPVAPVAAPAGGPLPPGMPLPEGTPEVARPPVVAPRPKVNKAATSGVDTQNRTIGGLTRDQFIANALADGKVDERTAGAMFDRVLPPVGSTIMRPAAGAAAPVEQNVWTEIAASKAPQSMSTPPSSVPGALTAPDKPDTESSKYQDELRAKWLADPLIRENMARAGAYQTVRQLVSTPRPSGADDAALIMQFNRLLDPMTGVRDAEYQRTGNIGGFIEGLQRYVSGKIEGNYLTPLQRKELLAATENVMKGHMKNVDDYAAANLRALKTNPYADPKQIIIDPYGGVRKDVGKPPAPAAGSGKTRSGVSFSNW